MYDTKHLDSKGRVLRQLWKEKEKVISRNRLNREDKGEVR